MNKIVTREEMKAATDQMQVNLRAIKTTYPFCVNAPRCEIIFEDIMEWIDEHWPKKAPRPAWGVYCGEGLEALAEFEKAAANLNHEVSHAD